MEDYYGIKSRRAREYIRSLPFKKKIPWKAMFPKTNDLALDLLERLLAFNPVKRITVEEALKHPYLEPYHDPDDEPTADPIPEEFFDFDKNKDNLTKEQLKRTSLATSSTFIANGMQFLSFRRSCDKRISVIYMCGIYNETNYDTYPESGSISPRTVTID